MPPKARAYITRWARIVFPPDLITPYPWSSVVPHSQHALSPRMFRKTSSSAGRIDLMPKKVTGNLENV